MLDIEEIRMRTKETENKFVQEFENNKDVIKIIEDKINEAISEWRWRVIIYEEELNNMCTISELTLYLGLKGFNIQTNCYSERIIFDWYNVKE